MWYYYSTSAGFSYGHGAKWRTIPGQPTHVTVLNQYDT